VATVASRPVVTQRDLEVLSFAVEMFAVSMPLVAELVARQPGQRGSRQIPDRLTPTDARRVAHRLAARLEAGGYARRVVVATRAKPGSRAIVAGEVWLVPTEAGLSLGMAEDAEKPYDVWRPAGWKLEHHGTVAWLRLWLEDQHPGARWESERAIRRRWQHTGARVRMADGGLYLPDGRAIGQEVELNVKRQHAEARYGGFVRDQDSAWTGGVWWWTRRASVELLRRRLDQAGAVVPEHEVYPLPDGIGR
jgi:hypothetical protein